MAAESARRSPETPVGNPEAPKSLVEAIHAVQAEAPTLQKTATNPHFKSKFTPLDKVVETLQPLLTKNGLVWMVFPCRDEHGEPAVRYRLEHVGSGEVLEETMPLLIAKDDPQGQGSAITYARRYCLQAVFNVVADTDDDGNAAVSARDRERKARYGSAQLSEDQVIRMRNEISSAGLNHLDVYREVGIAVEADTTLEQAKHVKALVVAAVHREREE